MSLLEELKDRGTEMLPGLFGIEFTRLSAPRSTVFENFLLDTQPVGDLPAKQRYRSPRILDLARMGEQQGNRNHPSIRRSFAKERFSKHAPIAKM